MLRVLYKYLYMYDMYTTFRPPPLKKTEMKLRFLPSP